MPLIPILSRSTASVLFSLDIEPNTVRLTLEAAVTARANLGGADLRDANLRDANLRNANLRGADLRDANLGNADLRNANLRNADLGDADLRNADLRGADLRDANLRDANLGDANLRNADLGDANLRNADLGDADLRNADLRGADLRDANLGDANLRGANLRNADLRDANLGDANLRDAKNAALAQARTSIVPESGAFDGWKLCKHRVLVHLRIPSEAQRSSATGRKCRAEYAEVLDVIGAEEGVSLYDDKTLYRAGARVRCDQWNPNRWEECSGGIHFYLNRIEAENHS